MLAEQLKRVCDGPLVAVIGSCSSLSKAQINTVIQEGNVEVVRCAAEHWLQGKGARPVDIALGAAQASVHRGRHVLFASDGAVAQVASRSLVESMAACAAPVAGVATALLLSGGDTARAVLEALGIGSLEVLGEFEPGTSISRPAGGQGPLIFIKAGSFGDARALQRAVDALTRRRRVPTDTEQA